MNTLRSLGEFSFRDGLSNVALGGLIDTVVLDTPEKTSRAYFDSGFDSQGKNKPACYSTDAVRPNPKVETPQCKTCAVCPQNAWGSSPHGKGKACAEYSVIQVMLCSSEHGYMLLELKLNASSAKNFRSYQNTLAKRQCDIESVVTTIEFEGDSKYQLAFSYTRYPMQNETEILNKLKAFYSDAPAFVEVQGLNNQHNL